MTGPEPAGALSAREEELLDLAQRLWVEQGPSCPECGRFDWVLAWRFRLRPIGESVLAGMQMKTTAQRVIMSTCRACDTELRVQLVPVADDDPS